MIVAVDIGNTNVSVGIYRAAELIALRKARRPRGESRKCRSWWKRILLRVIADARIGPGDLTGSAVSSVVPAATKSALGVLAAITGRKPLLVRGGLGLGLNIKYDDPDMIGPDRVCAMFAARKKYGKPVIIVDCGTAVTFDGVDRRGNHTGGMIAPGLSTAASALGGSTAVLPRVRWAIPDHPAGHATGDAIRAGVYYSVVGSVRENVKQLKKLVGAGAVVVGTGGDAEALSRAGRLFDVIDPTLVLEGAMRAYRLIRKKPTASRRGAVR